MRYRFDIDGIGVEFKTVYRQKIESGIRYQVKELLGFWKSNKNHAYIIVYERQEKGGFPLFPTHVAKVSRSGEYIMIAVDEWEKERKNA